MHSQGMEGCTLNSEAPSRTWKSQEWGSWGEDPGNKGSEGQHPILSLSPEEHTESQVCLLSHLFWKQAHRSQDREAGRSAPPACG